MISAIPYTIDYAVMADAKGWFKGSSGDDAQKMEGPMQVTWLFD